MANITTTLSTFERELQSAVTEKFIDSEKLVEKLDSWHIPPEEFGKEMLKGNLIQKLLEVSDEDYQVIYEAAHHHFEVKEYKEAAEHFMGLMQYDCTRPSCWLSFAHCCFKLEEFDSALKAYVGAAFIDPTNPEPLLFMVPILLRKGERDAVAETLDEVIRLAKENHEYRQMEEDARAYKLQLFGKGRS